jgi:hypothetical protein
MPGEWIAIHVTGRGKSNVRIAWAAVQAIACIAEARESPSATNARAVAGIYATNVTVQRPVSASVAAATEKPVRINAASTATEPAPRNADCVWVMEGKSADIAAEAVGSTVKTATRRA